MVTALVVGGVEMVAMILLSVYGAMRLPPEAHVPPPWAGRWGSLSAKRAGLVAYPAVGAFFFVLLAAIGLTLYTNSKSAFSPGIFLPIVLCVILLIQVRAIDQARRAEAGTGAGTGAGPEAGTETGTGAGTEAGPAR